MNTIVFWISIAGAIHLAILATNAALPRRLNVAAGIAPLPRFLRQVFIVHWIYIVLVVATFAALCLFFGPDLAGRTPLGRFLAGAMALFWLLRIVLQVFYYDRDLRRQNRALDFLYLAALSALVLILGFAALHPAR